MGEFGIGQPVPREEDPYLVRGEGRYVDDVQLVGQAARLRAALAACACAHPRRSMSTAAKRDARRAAGAHRQRPGRSGARPAEAASCRASAATARPAFARRSRCSRASACATSATRSPSSSRRRSTRPRMPPRRSRSITRCCRRLPTLEDAITPGAPAVWDECPDNIAFLHEAGDKAAAEEAIAAAAHVITPPHGDQPASPPISMEPRGCLAEYDPRDDRITLRCTVQGPHLHPPLLARRSLQGAGNQVPRHLRECRRRLRHEGRRSIRNTSRRRWPRAARPAGEMDLRPQRRPALRRALPRQHHRGRARARQGRQVPGASGPHTTPTSAPTTPPTAAPGRRPTISACSPAPT